MIELFVRRPVTTIVFVSFFIVLGIVSFFNLNIEETPKIDFPIITVKVTYPGATPSEMETQIIKRIENAISEISELKHVSSYAYESYAQVVIEFMLEADVNIKSIEIKDKVEAIIEDFPSGAKKPIIEKFDPLAKPVIDLVLKSDAHSLKELYEYADKQLKNHLTVISGVATVNILGGNKRQININLDPILMKRNFITIDKVIETIKNKNLNIPGGNVDTNKTSISVRFLGEYSSVEDIKNTPITSPEGNIVFLRDIAKIEDGYKKQETKARFNQKEVVSLSLINVSDANAINISNNVKKLMPTLNSKLPHGMELEIASDSTTFIQAETLDTELNILTGIILTIIILFIFTGSLKVTLISAVIIPTSIISTMFLMDQSEYSINMMTLLAIATALGTLIANAIIIIENVMSHLNQGKNSVEAAIIGTKEVTVAVLASAGTNLVVFAPIAFMEGIVGRFMVQFGFTVIYATLFSLVASFSLTPMLCAVILKNKQNKKGNFINEWVNKFLAFLLNELKVIFDLIFKYPKITIILSITLCLSSFLLAPYLGNEFNPTYDKNQIAIILNLPQGSLIEETDKVVTQVESILRNIPEVKSILSTIGENGTENATVLAQLIDRNQRTKDDLSIIQNLIPPLSLIPDTEFSITRGKSMGPTNRDIVINVYGENYEKLIHNSSFMKELMEKTGLFQSVASSYKPPKDELRFIPDQKILSSYGIPSVYIASLVRASIYGDDSNIFKDNNEEYKINVELSDQYMDSESDVENINLITRNGLFPLNTFGKIEKTASIPSIRRRDKERVITLSGDLIKSSAGQVRRLLAEEFKKIKLEPNSGFYFSGNSEHQQESESELGKAFLLASILTFMVLAAILNSSLFPIAIIMTIFTSLTGVILGLFFTGFSINIASLLAVVMLVGLVVNNAIILLDHTMVKMSEGVPVKDALWIGIKAKLQVILMTTLAIIAGTLPQLQAQMAAKASMGAVIIGGMLVSTLFTFVLTPVLFWYLANWKNKTVLSKIKGY